MQECGKMPERVRVQEVFNDVRAHRRVADLIRRYSTNKRDIRRVATEGLDLRACRSLLDLGCAFGSFATSLQGRVHPRAAITGVDVVEAYEPMFLDACRRAGMGGRFFSGGASVLKTFADRSYDLILCSYALYFFPDAVQDIARLLSRDGIFVAITHHQRNAGELIDLTKDILRAEGLFRETKLPFETIIGRFSSENGEALLSPCFGQVRTIDYINSLVFPPADALRLLEYFRFKSPLYFMGTGMEAEVLLSRIRDRLLEAASGKDSLTVSKNDRIFVCEWPRHGESDP
jgi:ubiquinone/menaquinone biosynthesis C-methylase UbiE